MTDTSKHIDLTGSFADGLTQIERAFKRRLFSLGPLLRLLLFLGLVILFMFFVGRSEGDILAIVFLLVFFLIFVGQIFSRSQKGTHHRRMRRPQLCDRPTRGILREKHVAF